MFNYGGVYTLNQSLSNNYQVHLLDAASNIFCGILQLDTELSLSCWQVCV